MSTDGIPQYWVSTESGEDQGGIIETRGRGTLKIARLMQEAGHEPPTVSLRDGAVIMTFGLPVKTPGKRRGNAGETPGKRQGNARENPHGNPAAPEEQARSLCAATGSPHGQVRECNPPRHSDTS